MLKYACATKTCMLWLSQVALGQMCICKCISGCYFSPEWCLSRCPCICGPWNSSRMWHKHVARWSSGKRCKCKPQHSAWDQIYMWAHHRLVRESKRTCSKACHYSRRGCMCGGMHTMQSGRKTQKHMPWHSAWGHMYEWVHHGLICISERIYSRVCCYSGRVCMCRGMHQGEWSKYRHVGVFICSSRDHIRLGALAWSLTCSI